MKPCIAISGGGTGGHLAIAKALMQECQKNDIPCIYIGSTSGQDQAWFQDEKGFQKTYFLPTGGVVNQRGLGILSSLYSQFRAFLKARKILKTHQINCVFSVGGYSSAPASFASISLFLPLFIHEQNAIKGTLNKILSPFAKKIFGSFTQTQSNFCKTSYPVRDEFFTYARERKTLKTILFLGGSQGAVAINNFALQIAPLLAEKGVKIIHQSGERDFERLSKAYAELKLEVELFAFSSDLVKKMQEADFCISRAGASSVWEMCANALPALYIPYPYAAKNHQYYNALFFSSQNLGILCPQEKLKQEILDEILSLDLSSISQKLSKQIKAFGAKEILDTMLQSFRKDKEEQAQ